MTFEAGFCPLLSSVGVTGKLNRVRCVPDCQWYCRLVGMDPQSGNPRDEFGCAIAWLPILMVENTNMSRENGAATESMRNLLAKGMLASAKAALKE